MEFNYRNRRASIDFAIGLLANKGVDVLGLGIDSKRQIDSFKATTNVYVNCGIGPRDAWEMTKMGLVRSFANSGNVLILREVCNDMTTREIAHDIKLPEILRTVVRSRTRHLEINKVDGRRYFDYGIRDELNLFANEENAHLLFVFRKNWHRDKVGGDLCKSGIARRIIQLAQWQKRGNARLSDREIYDQLLEVQPLLGSTPSQTRAIKMQIQSWIK